MQVRLSIKFIFSTSLVIFKSLEQVKNFLLRLDGKYKLVGFSLFHRKAVICEVKRFETKSRWWGEATKTGKQVVRGNSVVISFCFAPRRDNWKCKKRWKLFSFICWILFRVSFMISCISVPFISILSYNFILRFPFFFPLRKQHSCFNSSSSSSITTLPLKANKRSKWLRDIFATFFPEFHLHFKNGLWTEMWSETWNLARFLCATRLPPYPFLSSFLHGSFLHETFRNGDSINYGSIQSDLSTNNVEELALSSRAISDKIKNLSFPDGFAINSWLLVRTCYSSSRRRRRR